jgi:hypothetical protein
MFRVAAALSIGLLCLAISAIGATSALASDTWCDTDPPVLVQTPGGHTVAVYVSDGGPVEHVASLLVPQISYSVVAVQGGTATDVTMIVTVPGDLLGTGYAVSSEVWSGLARTGVEYASAQGTAGQPLRLRFRLPVS